MPAKYSYNETLAADNASYSTCPMCGQQEAPPEAQVFFRDAMLLRRIYLLFEKDVIGADSLLLRALGNWTLEEIGKRHGITRQAVEQREQQLAKEHPALASVLIDLAKKRQNEYREEYEQRLQAYSRF